MKRNKILALIGAGVLAMGVVGTALATELQENQAGKTLGSFNEDCDNFGEIGAGEIGVHFVLNGASAESGLLSADFSTDSFTDEPSDKGNNGTVHWWVVITGDADTVLNSASTDIDGNNLVLSHICAGDEETTTESTTSFSSSEESTTTSEESTTSFSSSQQSSTTQPPTDTIGNTGSGQQSSGLWMLLAALGVLAGSVIVLAPSKAKSKD
jgi:hypothetical protein